MNPKAAIEELDGILDYIKTSHMRLEEGGPTLDPSQVAFRLLGDVGALATIVRSMIRDQYGDDD